MFNLFKKIGRTVKPSAADKLYCEYNDNINKIKELLEKRNDTTKDVIDNAINVVKSNNATLGNMYHDEEYKDSVSTIIEKFSESDRKDKVLLKRKASIPFSEFPTRLKFKSYFGMSAIFDTINDNSILCANDTTLDDLYEDAVYSRIFTKRRNITKSKVQSRIQKLAIRKLEKNYIETIKEKYGNMFSKQTMNKILSHHIFKDTNQDDLTIYEDLKTIFSTVKMHRKYKATSQGKFYKTTVMTNSLFEDNEIVDDFLVRNQIGLAVWASFKNEGDANGTGAR